MVLSNPQKVAKWLVKVGKERTLLWFVHNRIVGDDAIISMLWKAFLAGGLGDDYANMIIARLKFRAKRANMHLYDYLVRRQSQGNLNQLMNILAVGRNERQALLSLLNIIQQFNLIYTPASQVNMDNLYQAVINARGIGDWLGHFIIYDLIRHYGYPTPTNLGPSQRLLNKLQTLGFQNPQQYFSPEDWPYVDAAVWDL